MSNNVVLLMVLSGLASCIHDQWGECAVAKQTATTRHDGRIELEDGRRGRLCGAALPGDRVCFNNLSKCWVVIP